MDVGLIIKIVGSIGTVLTVGEKLYKYGQSAYQRFKKATRATTSKKAHVAGPTMAYLKKIYTLARERKTYAALPIFKKISNPPLAITMPAKRGIPFELSFRSAIMALAPVDSLTQRMGRFSRF